jgi:hypothetical protein
MKEGQGSEAKRRVMSVKGKEWRKNRARKGK